MDRVLLKNKVKKDKVKYIQLRFSDLLGNQKYIMTSVDKIDELLEKGIFIDGSEVEGFLKVCDDDMILKPQLTSYTIVGQLSSETWNTARIDCVVHKSDGTPFNFNKEHVLSKVINEAKTIGLEYMTIEELSNFLFKRNIEVKPLQFAGLDPLHNN